MKNTVNKNFLVIAAAALLIAGFSNSARATITTNECILTGEILENVQNTAEQTVACAGTTSTTSQIQRAGNNATSQPTQAGKAAMQSEPGDDSETSNVVPIAGGMLVRSQSAGDGFGYPFGFWASYSRGSFEDEFTPTALDADSDSVFIGADFTPYDGYVFGVGLGYDSTDVDTTFNGGEVELTSISVVPYMAISLSEHLGTNFDLSMDAAIGYSSVDIDQFRVAGGARVTSSTRSDRWFGSGNLNAGQYFGDLYLSGRAGILISRDTTDTFQESDGTVVAENEVSFGRATIGGEAAYGWGVLEPFVNAYFQHDFDFDRNPVAGAANDASDVRVGLGLRFYGGDYWSGGIEYNKTLGRDQFDEDAISFTIRGDF